MVNLLAVGKLIVDVQFKMKERLIKKQVNCEDANTQGAISKI
jgi:hypothetical protein